MAPPRKCKKCRKPKRPKAKKYKDKEGYCECGRPTVIDETTLKKLEDAFLFSFTDEQACAYADILPRTLYNYQKNNPKFLHRKEQLKMRPDLKAKETVVKSLKNPNHAWRWLEKKDKEFIPKSKIEHAGTVEVSESTEEMSPEEKTALAALRLARRKRIEKQSKDK